MQDADKQAVPLADYQKVMADYQKVTADCQKMASEILGLKQRLAWYERMTFGRKSERSVSPEAVGGQLMLEFDTEQGQAVEASVRQMIEAHERRAPQKKESSHQGRVPIPADLPRVEEVIEPEEDVSGMQRIGADVTEVLEHEAGRIWVRRIVRPKYARVEASVETGQGQIVQAPAKCLPFGRSKAGVSLIVHILTSKYVDFFFYQQGRDHKGPKKLLDRFAGVLQCDGFSVYETLSAKIDSLRLMNCLAHIRREFFEAQSNDPQRAQTALTLIKLLYEVEEKARKTGLNAEQRLELRLKESKPVFDTLEAWLRTEYEKVTPASTIGKAIQYALNRWKNMLLFLADGHIEIDNNLVENIIRPAAIGRKNYLFAGSHDSAQRTAMLYTFFAACKHHGIDPEKWLNDVLNRIHEHKVGQLEELMPQNWKPAQEEKLYCPK